MDGSVRRFVCFPAFYLFVLFGVPFRLVHPREHCGDQQDLSHSDITCFQHLYHTRRGFLQFGTAPMSVMASSIFFLKVNHLSNHLAPRRTPRSVVVRYGGKQTPLRCLTLTLAVAAASRRAPFTTFGARGARHPLGGLLFDILLCVLRKKITFRFSILM